MPTGPMFSRATINRCPIVTTPKYLLKFRLALVIASCLLIITYLAILGLVVSGAFRSMAETADAIDDRRAITAANGALQSLRTHLGATVRDNAYWDDAYEKMGASDAVQWATENWGSTTVDYPLYDTALVIDPEGNPLVAYHKGEPLTDVARFFKGKLEPILSAARKPDPGRDALPVAFIETREGIAVVGAAAIQPYEFDKDSTLSDLKVLLFSKQLTEDVVADIGKTFTISGLSLERSVDERSLHTSLRDIAGQEIAFFGWPHVAPGSTSYVRVRPILIVSGLMLVLLLAGIAVAGYGIFRAIKSGERAADYRAKHDALTGLLNRAGFFEQIGIALETAPATTSLHMIDLDGFKPVNDAWGHAVGDQLIQAVAERLVKTLPKDAVISRLGGDEFAVIGCGHAGLERDTIQLILSALSTPFVIGGRSIEISGSIGTSNTRQTEPDATELLRQADLALYRAKDRGRGTSVLFDPSLDEDVTKTALLEQELRRALVNGDVHAVFQPLMDAASREVKGVEALARWRSPTRGDLPPDVFIRVAEKAGLIDQLGFSILRKTVAEAARWPGIGVSVNVSPLQLSNPYFAGEVEVILAAAGFDPARLTVEVTEGVLIANPDLAKRTFSALRGLGIKIALDDFGSGFASIGALREFGFDRMKIDRSLVQALDHDGDQRQVLQATIALAKALRLPVTAEGVETEEQAVMVRLSGCDQLQGFLFGTPKTADEITSLYFAPQDALAIHRPQ
jgi:diguanylate cyclase (GGDEF)-like protein